MKNIRKFETRAQRDAWLTSDEYVSPNVVLTEGVVEYNAKIDYSLLPLHIQAIEGLTIKFSNNYEYSKDNTTWMSGTSNTTISASAGEKVYFRASGLIPNLSSGIGRFTISNGTCNIAGNVMSMVGGADFVSEMTLAENQFRMLFYNAANIIDASNLILPATTLSSDCYSSMFEDCTSLVSAPVLPATSLATGCYLSMFYGCTSLVSAPVLPATTLTSSCYSYMFEDCTSLVSAPELPATSLATGCYRYMFKDCTKLNYIKAMFKTTPSTSYTGSWVSGVSSSGTFVKNSAATWDVTGANGIPEGWTVETADA